MASPFDNLFGTLYEHPLTAAQAPPPTLTPDIVPSLPGQQDIMRWAAGLAGQAGQAGLGGAVSRTPETTGFEEMPLPRDDILELSRSAIARLESGGSYQTVVPSRGPRGERREALGRYGIMDFNLGEWSQAAIGRNVTRNEFLANPEIQDAIFRHRFGTYLAQTGGNAHLAAAMWFAGPSGLDNPNRDRFGTDAREYVRRFAAALGQPAPTNDVVTGAVGGTPGGQPPPSGGAPGNLAPGPAPGTLESFLQPMNDFLYGPAPRLAGRFGGPLDMVDVARGSVPQREYTRQQQEAAAAIIEAGQRLRIENPNATAQQLAALLIRHPVYGRNALMIGANAAEILNTAVSDPTLRAPVTLPHDATLLRIDPATGQPTALAHGLSTRADPRDTRGVAILENIANEGTTAARALSDLTTMRSAFARIDRGGSAAWITGLRGIAAGYGIPVQGQSDLNLVQAIAARLAPTLRTPGSGAMSDFETRNLLASIPSVWNSPTGRAYILEQLERLSRYQQDRANIANQYFSNDENAPNRATAFRRLIELDNRFAEEMRRARERQLGGPVQIGPETTIRPVN